MVGMAAYGVVVAISLVALNVGREGVREGGREGSF
jgi:hypothetical protein